MNYKELPEEIVNRLLAGVGVDRLAPEVIIHWLLRFLEWVWLFLLGQFVDAVGHLLKIVGRQHGPKSAKEPEPAICRPLSLA